MVIHSSWNPNEHEIFAGLANLKLPIDTYDFGHGIQLSKTYTHVFGPYMAAFKEAEKGEAHPAPWKAVGGGISFDIFVELFVPLNITIFRHIDRLNTAWIITALLRLKIFPFVSMPIISNIKYSLITETSEAVYFQTIEVEKNNLFNQIPRTYKSNVEDFEWIKSNLINIGQLFEQNNKYAFTLLCLDRCISESRFSLALLTLWGGLEQIFSPNDKQEISYRTSLNIASYLEEKGQKRAELFKRVRKLYTARSKAAHGNPTEDKKEFVETYDLMREVFCKMTIQRHVPSEKDFEKLILES